MKVKDEEVRTVSGLMFQIINDYEETKKEADRLVYMLFLRDEWKMKSFISVYKFIRMLTIPYRIALIDNNGIESVCFLLYGDKDEAEELDSTMDWVAGMHPEWIVLNKNSSADIPKIIGFHIPNNSFHARRLLCQGKVFD